MIISNSGPLIHLVKVGELKLLKELFGEVMIPHEVKLEVVDKGKEEVMADAFLIENEIKSGWILIDRSNNEKATVVAQSVGIDIGEVTEIMLASKKKCQVLIDDLAARRFATGLGLEVVGSIGVLIRSARMKTISSTLTFWIC